MSAIAFVWDNYGPMHVDRCQAVASGRAEPVIGIEFFSKSSVYDWKTESGAAFEKVTLFSGGGWKDTGAWAMAKGIVSVCRARDARHVFLCHYEQPGIFLAAILLRLLGRRVFAMGCSKFDDQPRKAWREALKSLFFLPYHGAISSGIRSADYMRFLGIPAGMVATEYNTLSIERIRRLSGKAVAPEGTAFAERHFTIIARLVPKKNLFMALDAYAHYRERTAQPRPLHICGSGPLEADLRTRIAELGLQELVILRGFIQTAEISSVLGDTLAMLLPSIEEQFGNVVIEAQAMGVPVILSDNCGARDRLIRGGVNGFIIEPDNPEGLAYFMALLDGDETLWRRFAEAAAARSVRGDVANFLGAVSALMN
ncbi:glycosyltransferase [Ancylobacter sp. 6x-1]|uniref:Glycosyltransferase n=1 Tax=Ancylobacter crimeensis TaxID=2579147 RepID=A0ABT0D6M1_9HYPH|nr:glycosyltransferase [Ancylobacter crimeensis]MCK0195601.1 glycosyltransferase [Ancylobacter crimeensis]